MGLALAPVLALRRPRRRSSVANLAGRRMFTAMMRLVAAAHTTLEEEEEGMTVGPVKRAKRAAKGALAVPRTAMTSSPLLPPLHHHQSPTPFTLTQWRLGASLPFLGAEASGPRLFFARSLSPAVSRRFIMQRSSSPQALTSATRATPRTPNWTSSLASTQSTPLFAPPAFLFRRMSTPHRASKTLFC